jgi:putative selenium metabolism hydrolase
MPPTFKILNDIPMMIDALKDEIDHIKKNKHQVVLFDGILINERAPDFIYRFELPEGIFMSMVEEIEIYVNGKTGPKLSGEIISIENQFILIKLSSNQGKTIPQLTIGWNLDAISRKLMQRLELVFKNPKQYQLATTDQLFYPNSNSNTLTWKQSLILPTRTFITDPPKEFTANNRQQEVLQSSLNNRVTYVWGPPGTGKTQTLGMIAYNLIRGGKRVLFSSNTNRAVDIGVLSTMDRYKEHGGEFLEEVTRFGQIALQGGEDFEKVMFSAQVQGLRELKKQNAKQKIELLENFRHLRDKLGPYKIQIERINSLNHQRTQQQIVLNTILQKLKSLRSQIDNFENVGFIEAFKRKFSGVTKITLEVTYKTLQEKGKELKVLIEKSSDEQASIEKAHDGLASWMDEFSKSKKAVDGFGGESALSKRIEAELAVDEEQILWKKKFVGATLAKLVMNDVFWRVRFDVLLIDEASMVNLPYLAVLSALSTERVIIVGDPQQLPPISFSDNAQTKLWLQRDIYLFASQCNSSIELFKWNQLNPKLTIFLNTQYRMASNLCTIISDFFYQGRLLNGLDHPDCGQIIFIDSSPLSPSVEKLPGKRYSPYNRVHTAKVIEAIKTALAIKHYRASDIGIIAPFIGTGQYIREQLKKNELKNIEVGTVYTFQGREKPVIIFDTVMAGVNYTVRPFDELMVGEDQVRRLLNVALSRAKRDIFIIADMSHFKSVYQGKMVYELLQRLNSKSNDIEVSRGTLSYNEMSEEEKNKLLGIVVTKNCMNLYQTIYNRAKEIEDGTIRILMDLVRTPSFSSKEKEVVQVVRREMEKAGLEGIRIDGLGSIVGHVGNGPKKIAFDGHVDTVYAGDLAQWSFDPFQPKIEDGKVWGRGTVDQKGGLAAMLSAARLIKEMNLNEHFTVYFIGTVMEEDCEGLCWQYLINEEKLRPDVAVLTEPTNMRIYRGHRGRMEMRVEVTGRSCHSSAPERGDNAIYKLARIALEIEKLNERMRIDPFLGKGSVTVTEAGSSSPSICAVPDGASIRIDRRLIKGESKEGAVAEVCDAAKRAGYDDANVVVLTFREPAYTGKVYPTEKYYPTWALDENSPFLKSAVDVYAGLFGNVPSVGMWTFSSNATAIAGMYGIPCLLFGPGNELYAHAPNEACEIEHLSGAAAFYAALVAKLNGKV